MTAKVERGDVVEAEEFHQQYISLIETEGSLFNSLEAFLKLAQSYREQAQLDTALMFYQQALVKASELQEQDELFASTDWHGRIFGNMAEILQEQEQTDTSFLDNGAGGCRLRRTCMVYRTWGR